MFIHNNNYMFIFLNVYGVQEEEKENIQVSNRLSYPLSIYRSNCFTLNRTVGRGLWICWDLGMA